MEIEAYFEQNAVDGVLTDDAMANLLIGNMGETAAPAESGDAPDPAPQSDEANLKTEDQAGDGKLDPAEGDAADPIVLAKDGKNVIPYGKLTEAREEAKAYREQTAALMQEMESIKAMLAQGQQPGATQPDAVAEPAPAAVDIAALEREYYNATMDGEEDRAVEIRVKINSELMRQAREDVIREVGSQQSARDQQAAVQTAQSALDSAAIEVSGKYPVLDLENGGDPEKVGEVVEYRDFLIHVKGIPAHDALRQAAEKVLGKVEVKAPASDTVAPKTVKTNTPTSLSDIPAGSAAHHDEAEALTQMSHVNMVQKMMGMDPSKIEALISKMV